MNMLPASRWVAFALLCWSSSRWPAKSRWPARRQLTLRHKHAERPHHPQSVHEEFRPRTGPESAHHQRREHVLSLLCANTTAFQCRSPDLNASWPKTDSTKSVPGGVGGGLLTAETISRARSAVPGDRHRWWRVIAKAAACEPIKIVVLGGSMPHGTGTSCGPACAWPKRLERWLHAAYPQAHITLLSAAASATNTQWAMANMHTWWGGAADEPDLILVDYTINETPHQVGGYAHVDSGDRAHPWTPAQAVAAAREYLTQKRSSTELLLRRVLANKRVALVYLETFNGWATNWNVRKSTPQPDPELHIRRAASDIDRMHQTVLQPLLAAYGVPVISYRDAVWPDPATPPRTVYWSWQGRERDTDEPAVQHPGDATHQIIADLIAEAWRAEARAWVAERAAAAAAAAAKAAADVGAECRARIAASIGALLPNASTEALDFDCATPATYFAIPPGAVEPAFAERGFRPAAPPRGTWRLFDDSPSRSGEKLGWISNGTRDGGDRIEFVLRDGPAGALALTFMRSYEHMGRARVSLSRSIAADEQPEVTAFGDDAAAVSSVFDGSWTDVSSQLVVEVGVLSAGSLACFSAHSTVSARSG